jgi:hypothetical protein
VTILPQPTSPNDQWILDDYAQRSAASPAAAGGVAQVQFGPVPDDRLWFLERLAVSCNSSSATTCTLYLDIIDPTHALDYTPAGNFDIADEAAPIQLPTGSTLLVVWSNASAGAIGTARAQFVVMRRQTS